MTKKALSSCKPCGRRWVAAGQGLLMLLQKANEVSGTATLLQTPQGTDEPGGTHLELLGSRTQAFWLCCL